MRALVCLALLALLGGCTGGSGPGVDLVDPNALSVLDVNQTKFTAPSQAWLVTVRVVRAVDAISASTAEARTNGCGSATLFMPGLSGRGAQGSILSDTAGFTFGAPEIAATWAGAGSGIPEASTPDAVPTMHEVQNAAFQTKVGDRFVVALARGGTPAAVVEASVRLASSKPDEAFFVVESERSVPFTCSTRLSDFAPTGFTNSQGHSAITRGAHDFPVAGNHTIWVVASVGTTTEPGAVCDVGLDVPSAPGPVGSRTTGGTCGVGFSGAAQGTVTGRLNDVRGTNIQAGFYAWSEDVRPGCLRGWHGPTCFVSNVS